MKPLPEAIRNLIIQKIQTSPQTPYEQIAKEFGVCYYSVNKLARKAGVSRRRGPKVKIMAVIHG